MKLRSYALAGLWLATLGLWPLLGQAAIANPAQVKQTIDSLVQTEMQTNTIPGLALAVVVDGQPFLLKGYGMADQANQQAVTPQTLFGIGSVSKVFTGLAVMQLVQAGKIDVHASIRQYLPDAPEAWQAVTVQELMSHTGGIPKLDSRTGAHHAGQDASGWQQVWAHYARMPMRFTPGSQYEYSNLGFEVLGRLVEVVSGERLGEYFKAHIFQVADMQDTSMPGDQHPEGLATGYLAVAGQLSVNNSTPLPWQRMWGSGGIVSNVEDMAKWDAAMTRGAFLSPATYALMWKPVLLNNGQPSGWSLGWQVHQPDGRRVAFKNGGIKGYSSLVFRYLDDKVDVIVLTNATHLHFNKLCKQIGQVVIAHKN